MFDKLSDKKIQAQRNISKAAPIIFVLSVLTFFIYTYIVNFTSLALKTTGVFGALNSNNMVKYVIGLAVLAVAFVLFRTLFSFVNIGKVSDLLDEAVSKKVNLCVAAVCTLSFAVYMYLYLFDTELSDVIYGASPEQLQWRNVPFGVLLCYVGAVVVLVLWGVYQGRDSSSRITFAVYLFAAVLTYYSLLYIIMPDWHHGTAYIESIYLVYSGVPYNFITTGIYGHYGIIYGLLLRIFSGDYIMLAHMIALVGAISTLACAYIIHTLVKKNYIRVIAILSCVLSIGVMRYRNYWQLQPHRIVFPLIVAAYLTYMVKKKKFSVSNIIAGYAVCMLAVLWNTESGMFCTVAYSIALVVHFWQSEPWYSKRMLVSYVGILGGIVAALAGAILVVNIYNLAVGGELILKEFFFPIFDGEYINGVLKYDLVKGIQIWNLVLTTFMVLLLMAFAHTKFIKADKNENDIAAPVYVAIAVLGLLNFSYYANRAAYFNLDICIQLVCIAAAILADRYADSWKDIFTRRMTVIRGLCITVSFLLVITLTVLATQIVFCVQPLLRKNEDGIWDYNRFKDEAQEFFEIVPEDCLVLGSGASMYLLQLERPSKLCYRDFSDLYVGGTDVADAMVEDALNYGKVTFVLTDDYSYEIMDRVLSKACFYEKISQGEVGQATVVCYEVSK